MEGFGTAILALPLVVLHMIHCILNVPAVFEFMTIKESNRRKSALYTLPGTLMLWGIARYRRTKGFRARQRATGGSSEICLRTDYTITPIQP
jgi:hypothetical protein